MSYGRLIRKRLINLGVPQTVAADVAFRFQTQVMSRGPEGACQYLKKVGDAVIWYLDPSVGKPTWVKTRDRFPTFLSGMESLDKITLLRVAKFARAIRLDKPSTTQVEKAKHGVLDDPHCVGGLDDLQQLIAAGVSFWGLSSMLPGDLNRPQPVTRSFRKVVSVSGKTPLTMEPPILDSLDILARVEQLRNVPGWEWVLYPIHPTSVKRLVNEQGNLNKGSDVGQIYAAQEGGAKLRMFAAPFTVVQCVLSPIHDWIDRYRRVVLTDCTYDQLSGARFAQLKMSGGSIVHSVDLSTATCRFPLGPQLDLLRNLGLESGALEALRWACQGTWSISKDLRPFFKRKVLRWRVGQPLGIRPSMSMFSLTHNLVLTGLCVRWGLDPLDTFRVLGDDVVIAHDLVARDYKLLMDEIGVPRSIPKSHTSSAYAEFAGASILPDVIVRGGQWKPLTYQNALGLAELYQRPLLGEGTLILEEIQKIHLFGRGLFEPPVEQYSKFVRLYSLVSGADRLLGWLPPSGGKSWYSMIKKKVNLLVGYNKVTFFPEPDPLRTVWKTVGLSDNELRSDPFYGASTSIDPEMFEFDIQISWVATQAWLSILCRFENGLMSKEEAVERCDALYAASASLLYMPPRDAGRRLHALADQYRSAILAAA